MNVPGFTPEFSLNGCNQYNIMYFLDNNNEYVIPVRSRPSDNRDRGAPMSG